MDYDAFLKLGIDLAPVGMEQGESISYYCTPRRARILGWAGVDGIHYCTIPEFGEIIFAVNPMNPGDCVHPIARCFEDLLRLLLACGDMAALEQCHGWEEAQFNAFATDCSQSEAQMTVLREIREKCNLAPMDNPYGYIKQLQQEFDHEHIPYPEEYYDLDMNSSAPSQAKDWKVYFEGNFWSNGRGKGRAGKEIALNKSFCWGVERWVVPSVYLCAKGLVVDFCTEIPQQKIRDYVNAWKTMETEGRELPPAQREEMERKNPLNIDFRPGIRVNGETLVAKSGCGVSWIPQNCLPEGERCELEAEACLAHYGLDKAQGWSFHRWCFPWGTVKKPQLRSLQIALKRELTSIEGVHFRTAGAGERISFTHPVTGQPHTLTVLGLEAQSLSLSPQQGGYELPNHCVAMTYKLEPELEEKRFRVLDCSQSDAPRIIASNGNTETNASTIGIIGGADGPTAVAILGRNAGETPQAHSALSALHFEPQSEVEWRMLFYDKRMEDIEVTLLP